MNNIDKIKRLYNLNDNNINFGFQENELVELETHLNLNLPEKLKKILFDFREK